MVYRRLTDKREQLKLKPMEHFCTDIMKLVSSIESEEYNLIVKKMLDTVEEDEVSLEEIDDLGRHFINLITEIAKCAELKEVEYAKDFYSLIYTIYSNKKLYKIIEADIIRLTSNISLTEEPMISKLNTFVLYLSSEKLKLNEEMAKINLEIAFYSCILIGIVLVGFILGSN